MHGQQDKAPDCRVLILDKPVADDADEFLRFRQALTSNADCDESADIPPVISADLAAVVVLHRHPGQWSLETLTRAAGEVPCTHILGAWCCGLKRLDRTLAAQNTFYLHELIGRYAHVWELLNAKARPANRASGPAAERAGSPSFHAGENATSNTPAASASIVGVCGFTHDFSVSLVQALSQAQVPAVEIPEHSSLAISRMGCVLWGADRSLAADGDALLDRLATLQRCYPAANVLALMTYPRQQDVEQLERRGVRVMAQPFALPELFAAVTDCCAGTADDERQLPGSGPRPLDSAA